MIMAMVLLIQSLSATEASVQETGAYSFLYTQNNQDNTRSLFGARISPTGVERLKLNQQSYATYPWTDVLCVYHSTLFAMNYSGLYSLDLKTKQVTRLVCDVIPHYDQLTCVDHRAYGVSDRQGLPPTLVILDFDRLAYTTLCLNPAPCANAAIAVSPGHERLAYHTQDPNGFRIAVIKTKTGDLVCQSQPFDFQMPLISSVFAPPPLAWIDDHRILSIESLTRSKFLSLILKKRVINQLTVFHLDTGRLKDILTLPGNPLMHFPPKLMHPTTDVAPRLVMNSKGLVGDYRLNLKARKLVADTIQGTPYRLGQGRLLFRGTELGQTQRHQINVDPQGNRIVWLQDEDLYYHDHTQNSAVLVARACEIRGVTWIDPMPCKSNLSRSPLPDTWTRFEQRSLPQGLVQK
jgi:hypothetical protein